MIITLLKGEGSVRKVDTKVKNKIKIEAQKFKHDVEGGIIKH